MEKNSRFFLVMIVLAISLVYSATSARLTEEDMIMEEHEKFIVRHGRVYKSQEEKEARFKIFKENLKYINEHNRAANNTFKMGITKFSDLTREEFLATYASGYKHISAAHTEDYYGRSFMYENVNVADLPASLDWREKGAVTPIKNQEHCDSCWVFSAVASMEGINKIKTGKLVSLSEQEILDCLGLQDTCHTGGRPEQAFNFVAQNGGLASESEYPYNDQYQEFCKTATPAAKITNYEYVPPNDEVSLLKAVANQPVSIGVNGDRLQLYTSGVITPNYGYYGEGRPNHAVTIVGYGTDEESGLNYWLIKNSWGLEHGENGYARLQKDSGVQEGTCALASSPSYPTI